MCSIFSNVKELRVRSFDFFYVVPIRKEDLRQAISYVTSVSIFDGSAFLVKFIRSMRAHYFQNLIFPIK